jgi:hypothetical protein
LPFSPNSGPVRGAYRAAACSGNRRRTLFVISPLALVFVAGDANALGPVEIEVAAKGGGGYPPVNGNGDGLGFALGGRAGVLLPASGLYGGLSFLEYGGGGGSTDPVLVSSAPMPVGGSYHSLAYGLEGGYGVRFFDELTVRAQLGLGDYVDIEDTQYSTGATTTRTHHSLYLEPGVMTMIALGPVFVGGDLNLLIADFAYQGSKYGAAFTLHAQLGVKF